MLQIKQTKDYDTFAFAEENRIVEEKDVIAMEEYCVLHNTNFLNSKPINVNSQMIPGKLAITDGQKRYKLSIRLGEPVYYILDDDIGSDEIIPMNAFQKRWSMSDYLNFYCKRGKRSYLELKAVWELYPEWSLSAILAVFGFDSGGMFKMFRDGNIQVKGAIDVHTVLERINEFQMKTQSFKFSTTTIKALCKIVRLPEYNHDLMMKKFEYMSAKFVKCPSVDLYLKVLQEIYNYKTKASDQIRFVRGDYHH